MHTEKAHCQYILISRGGRKAISTQLSMWNVGREEKKGKHPVQGASRGMGLLVAVLGSGHRAFGSIRRPDFLSGDPSLHSQKAQ